MLETSTCCLTNLWLTEIHIIKHIIISFDWLQMSFSRVFYIKIRGWNRWPPFKTRMLIMLETTSVKCIPIISSRNLWLATNVLFTCIPNTWLLRWRWRHSEVLLCACRCNLILWGRGDHTDFIIGCFYWLHMSISHTCLVYGLNQWPYTSFWRPSLRMSSVT